MISTGEPPNRDANPKRTASDLTLHSGSSNRRRSRLHAILEGDQLAIIVTNLRIQAGIPVDRISR